MDVLIKIYFEPMLAERDIWMVSLAILAYWCWCFAFFENYYFFLSYFGFLSINLTSLRTFATTAPVDPTSYNGTAEQDRLELQEKPCDSNSDIDTLHMQHHVTTEKRHLASCMLHRGALSCLGWD